MTESISVVTAARERAAQAAEARERGAPLSWTSRGSDHGRRWFAIGDPQTTPERIFTVLDRYKLLADDGVLRADVGLVSVGDHFDFPAPVEIAERAGREVLAWLAAHPADQVVVLAGNHDVARVMELAHETDDSFARARMMATEIKAAPDDRRSALTKLFGESFPSIPTPGIARVDYSSFSVAQRALVQQLLLDRRLRLAIVARVRGVEVLVTHAGVTTRELDLLALDNAAPDVIANAMNALLDRRVDLVRDLWTRGTHAPLDLTPVHISGTTGREGGGLLYHRPARMDRAGAVDKEWEFAANFPRRFEPSKLPGHLAQVAGHSNHHRCAQELAGWADESAPSDTDISLRTLIGGPGAPRYLGRVEPAPGALVLIDPALAKAPLDSVELLALDGSP